MNLSREGIFPLTSDSQPVNAQTGWPFAGTIQGEGKLCGVPSIFVRLQGCNLRCKWTTSDGAAIGCDTAHTQPSSGGTEWTPNQVVNVITDASHRYPLRHVVITGGEPYLQADEVLELVNLLHASGLHVTIETNGTIEHQALTSAADLISVSPKCPVNLAAITGQAYDYQVKFVVSSLEDEAFILKTLNGIDVNAQNILLMPMGNTPALINQSAQAAAFLAVKHGWRFTPRLHIDLWGNKEGV